MEQRNLDILLSPWFAIVAFLALVTLDGAFKPNINQRRERNRNGSANDGKEIASPIVAAHQVSNAAPEQGEGNRPDESNGYEEKHLKFEKTIAEANDSVATFTKLLVAVGVVTAGLELWALFLTRRSANAATKAAEATERSVKWAEDSDRRLQRAYIYIKEASAVVAENKVINIGYEIANAGKTPAIDIKQSFWAVAQNGEEAKERLSKAIAEIDARAFLAAEENCLIKLPVNKTDITPNEPSVAYGKVGWKDIFGDKYAIEFTYLLIHFPAGDDMPEATVMLMDTFREISES